MFTFLYVRFSKQTYIFIRVRHIYMYNVHMSLHIQKHTRKTCDCVKSPRALQRSHLSLLCRRRVASRLSANNDMPSANRMSAARTATHIAAQPCSHVLHLRADTQGGVGTLLLCSVRFVQEVNPRVLHTTRQRRHACKSGCDFPS